MDARLRSGMQAYVFGVAGMFLVLAPWSGLYHHVVVWSQMSPVLGDVLASGWFRGLVSGLGVLDLAVAVREMSRARVGGGRPADRPGAR